MHVMVGFADSAHPANHATVRHRRARAGAGKTTLMSLINGLIRPDEGTITLDGEPITGPGPDRGVVFQNYSLLPWLTPAGR